MTATRAGELLAAARAALPRGGALSTQVWDTRHRGICVLLWCHVVVLVVIGSLRGASLLHVLAGPGLVAVLTVGATWPRWSQTTRSSLATLGLLLSTAILIDLFDGSIEAHFHFFVVIAVVALYQAWWPYLLGIGFVLVHHLVLGTILPADVYSHHMAVAHPWLFAGIHAGAVVAESVALLVFWRETEDALDSERANGEALLRANDDLTRANRAVSDLVAMLSHDLRIPLTVLMGYSEIALERWHEMSPTEQLEYVVKVGAAGHNLFALLEDTLTVSALDASGVEPRRVPVRVDLAVRTVLDTLPDPVPVADLRRLEAVTADVDRGHLSQILGNLMTNAVKYGDGSFTVSAREDAGRVCLRVSDSGPGVPEEFVPQLFDRFTRSEGARLGSQKGTGLGLYITRSLLAANGGDIHYEPTDGGGATFCLHLPGTAIPAGAADDTGRREHAHVV